MKRDTKQMIAGFDAQRGQARAERLPRSRPRDVAALRPMSVRQALEWAFGVECVALDFGDVAEWHCGTDTIWRLMRQQELGCRVDGGGRSASHPDAEVIASFVAALPVEYGGRAMAVQIAELARAGRCPDAMIDAQLRCVPARLAHGNQHGPRARAEDVPPDAMGAWALGPRVGRPSRAYQWCRVTYTPTAAQVAAARRNWLGWWGALLQIGHDLRVSGRLDQIVVTQDMPPLDPWNKRA